MRAWVVEKPAPLEESPLVERGLPVPEPRRGEVRLAVLACGVCHTDVHIAEGDLPPHRPSVVPGHQIVGRVEAAGPGVERPLPGERVGVTWLGGVCGACEFCADGRENLCREATFTGWDRDGGYAEFALARADCTVPLPEGLAPEEAAPLLCAGVIGYRSLRLSGIRPGQRLGLVGFGASAHLVLQVARHRGCEVYVFTRGEHHRRQALAMGAAWAGGLDEDRPAECHAQVLFAPSGALVPACLQHLRRGGTLAINAVHLSDIPPLPWELLFGERAVRSVSHVTRRDAREFLELAGRRIVRADAVPYPFEEAPSALRDVRDARLNGQAVLLPPR